MFEETSYVFNVTSIATDDFLEQISLALEKRTELISREKYSKLWAYTDGFKGKEKAPEAVLKKRRIFRKAVSAINLALGTGLFIPGLMDPKELQVPLVVGAAGIIVGLIGLFSRRGNSKNQFIKPARQLLRGKDLIVAGENRIVFSEKQMEMSSLKDGCAAIPYSELEYIIETKDAFLVTFRDSAAVLKKSDLQERTIEDFRDFICTKAPFVPLREVERGESREA